MANIQRGRTGWKKEEDTLLFAEIEKSVGRGTPLKSVFEAVAEQTGRKPNSVRNYYYARIKERDLSTTALHAGAFVPFTEEEIHSLLRTVLSAQANGISVRYCTMSMGGGDNRAMLRYQNKYRALLKNRPALVRQVAEELKAEGVDFDPYCTPKQSEGRGKAAGSVTARINRLKGMDGAAFIEGLDYITSIAEEAEKREETYRCTESELRERIRRQEEEINAQQGRFHALLLMYRRLVSANRDFIGMAGRETGPVSEYARQLARSVADCEKALTEYQA
ncbi:MAG: hypothetical protein SPK82_07375 [Eubacteriales bacterium]|nr:hypothetical protein [Eubacteriales bacterium]